MSRRTETVGKLALSFALLIAVGPIGGSSTVRLSGIRTALDLIDTSKRHGAIEESIRSTDDRAAV